MLRATHPPCRRRNVFEAAMHTKPDASGTHEPPSGGPHIGGAPATPIAALSGSTHKAPGSAGGYLLSHTESISSSIDHCHPSRFFIGNRSTAQSTIYSNRLVSSLSVVAINNAFAQGPPQLKPHSYRPGFGCQLTQRLGGSNAGAHRTARDTL
jgi:hypothetical protein